MDGNNLYVVNKEWGQVVRIAVTPDPNYGLSGPTPVAGVASGSYGIGKGLIYSYPVRSDGSNWRIVQGLQLTDFSKAKIAATEKELKEEKSLVSDLLPK